MEKTKERVGKTGPFTEPAARSPILGTHNRVCLDALQLNELETAFREWAKKAPSGEVRVSRKRILLIFLLIRYTGAKLNEILSLDPFCDIDFKNPTVMLRKDRSSVNRPARKIQISEALSEEIRSAIHEPPLKKYLGGLFRIDPGHVRRKFYERALACGFSKRLGSPDAIRKSRAVELMEGNIPLPVVQKIMGHATSNLVSSLVSFSDEEIRKVTKFFLEREARRKTSARNSFFGKISTIQKGDIQTKVELVTLGGDLVTTVITNDSLARLGLQKGSLVTAEIKAPLVVLHKSGEDLRCTAENRFYGLISRINRGSITTEYVVRIADGTDLCALVSTEIGRRLDLNQNDPVWAVFNSFSVVLHLE